MTLRNFDIELYSASPQIFTVELSVDPFNYVIHEGVLTGIPIGRLGSRESYEFDTPVVFTSSGIFNLSAEIRIPSRSGERGRFGRGRLKAVVEM